MKLNSDQQKVVTEWRKGKSLCLIGAAGTGKTALVKEIRRMCASERIPYVSLAFSNPAAQAVEGVTIHNVCGLLPNDTEGLEAFLEALARQHERPRPTYVRNLREVKVVFLDEFGIVGTKVWHCLDAALRLAKNKPKKICGGVQIVAVGDRKQLPSVKDTPCYTTQTWKSLFDNATFELTEIVRQADPAFVSFLTRARFGRLNGDDAAFLRERQLAYQKHLIDNTLPIDAHFVFPRRTQVDEENKKRYQELRQKEVLFVLYQSYGSEVVLPKKARSVCLKIGTVVTVNDGPHRGKRGIVSGFQSTGDRLFPLLPKIDVFRPPERIVLETVTKEWKKAVHAKWLPVELGWANTIHEVQCKTIFNMVVPIDKSIFMKKQAYAALSRPPDPQSLFVNGTVLDISVVQG
jgi:hypothetical protein